MNAVDTNVLIYVRDPRDAIKQKKAVELTRSLSNGVLLWQVAAEFVAASRKLDQFGFTQFHAWHELKRLRALWRLILPSEMVFARAEELTLSHRLSFWDGMVIAACMEGGVKRFYTEDFDNSISNVTGIEIVNPF